MPASLATIIIPFADYHSAIVGRALNSALAQTMPCDVRFDRSPGSPSFFRNRAAAKAQTPFVVFLDADDVLEPTFVEHCLKTYQTGRYVYTSWYEGDKIYKPKDCPWSPESHHIVTTLYPTALFNKLGGFDEELPGHEDGDFYMRSSAHFVCGIFLDEPLVRRPDDLGQRSISFHEGGDWQAVLKNVALRNGGYMACCGGSDALVNQPVGAILPGDVIAVTLWAGTRSENGVITQRQYIGGNGSKVSIDPRDAAARPDLFKVEMSLNDAAPQREMIMKQAGLI